MVTPSDLFCFCIYGSLISANVGRTWQTKRGLVVPVLMLTVTRYSGLLLCDLQMISVKIMVLPFSCCPELNSLITLVKSGIWLYCLTCFICSALSMATHDLIGCFSLEDPLFSINLRYPSSWHIILFTSSFAASTNIIWCSYFQWAFPFLHSLIWQIPTSWIQKTHIFAGIHHCIQLDNAQKSVAMSSNLDLYKLYSGTVIYSAQILTNIEEYFPLSISNLMCFYPTSFLKWNWQVI